MRGDVKGTFAAWIAATNDFAVGSRPGSTRGRVLHSVQFIFLFFFSHCLVHRLLFYLQEVVEPVGCEGRPV